MTPTAVAPAALGPVEVLDASVPGEFERWCALWSRWPAREVLAHPGYVRLFAGPSDRVVCVAAESMDGGILFPFILRPLSAEPWAAPQEDGWDLVTPYGYGGPFAWNSSEAAQLGFWAAFEAWAAQQHLVSSFMRLSLFPEQLARLPVESLVDRKNVVRTLQVEPELLWREYAHKVRKNVNRARRDGVEVRRDETGHDLDAFLKVYQSTMDRRGAADGYYFGRPFFEAILRDLPGQAVFFHAFAKGQIVSSELVLVSGQHLYSFLGGTLAEFFPLRPNDLLKHEVIEWGRAEGKAAFVLGGGFQDADGIFEYKLAFATGGAVDFRVVRWTHDSARYSQLLARRTAWEAARGGPWSPRPGFFPAYRAPAEVVV